MSYHIFKNFIFNNKPLTTDNLLLNGNIYIISQSKKFNNIDIQFYKLFKITKKYFYLKPVDFYTKLSNRIIIEDSKISPYYIDYNEENSKNEYLINDKIFMKRSNYIRIKKKSIDLYKYDDKITYYYQSFQR